MKQETNTPGQHNSRSADQPDSALRRAVRTGLHSARENALPGFILWIAAAAIVAGYWLLEPVHRFLSDLGQFKAESGYLYSAVATGIFGGLIPFLWRWTRGKKRARETGTQLWNVPAWAAGLFLTLFWAYKGVEIDWFYRLQALIFGSGSALSVLVPKVLVDQFVYNTLWAGWIQLLAYWWLERALKPAALVDPAFWRTIGPRLVTILISTWGVWIPMVCIIYSMPAELQVPLFNIALCFWSLMLASITVEKK